MAIANLQDTLFMYTKYKSRMNLKLSEIQINILQATKNQESIQQKFNEKQQEYYYYYNRNVGGEGMEAYFEEYNALCAELENEMQTKLHNVKSWEEQLQSDKLSYETRLAEISQCEKTVQAQLKTDAKSDFSYGGASQGS